MAALVFFWSFVYQVLAIELVSTEEIKKLFTSDIALSEQVHCVIVPGSNLRPKAVLVRPESV